MMNIPFENVQREVCFKSQKVMNYVIEIFEMFVCYVTINFNYTLISLSFNRT